MKITIALMMIILLSCKLNVNRSELIGMYIPEGFVNTFDTIILKENNIYQRKVYDSNHTLMFDQSAHWVMNDISNVTFNDFFLNLDRDLVQFPELALDTNWTMEATIIIKNNSTRFLFSNGFGKYYYLKH